MKHPDVIAWEKWKATEEGKQCLNAASIGIPESAQFIQNRLWRAFMAGRQSVPTTKKKGRGK